MLSADSLDVSALFAGFEASRGLVLAVSGGPDSVALLILIDRWRRENTASAGIPVHVATVDHGLRPEGQAEAEAVAALAKAFGMPHRTLAIGSSPPAAGLQNWARNARYGALCAFAREAGADTIVTAHHADDQAETILMRLTRGSGPAGLAGMAARSARDGLTIARPLLGSTKADLSAVCQDECVSSAIDPSNSSAVFRRTGLRVLAPVLAAEGLGRGELLRLGRRAARAEAALAYAAETIFAALGAKRSAGHFEADAVRAMLLPDEFFLRLLAREIAAIAADAGLESSSPRLERLESLLDRLRATAAQGTAFAETLGGCKVCIAKGRLTIGLAPLRRGQV